MLARAPDPDVIRLLTADAETGALTCCWTGRVKVCSHDDAFEEVEEGVGADSGSSS